MIALEQRQAVESLLKDANWLGRRLELLLANIRDGRSDNLHRDAASAASEAEALAKNLTAFTIENWPEGRS